LRIEAAMDDLDLPGVFDRCRSALERLLANVAVRSGSYIRVSMSQARPSGRGLPQAPVERPMAIYVSVSRLRVAAERSEELVSAFRQRAHLVDAADGFLGLEVWRSDRDRGEIVMVSRWRDRDCFKRYMRSEEHKVSHDRIPAGLDAAIKLERLEHLHTYEVVAS
jgi:heme-degrading monooxygenase HmoA